MNLDEKKLSSKELARKASREIHRAQNDISGHVSLNRKHERLNAGAFEQNLHFILFLEGQVTRTHGHKIHP